jgi:hypothetical protein
MFSTLIMYTFLKQLHFPMEDDYSYNKDFSHFPLPCCQVKNFDDHKIMEGNARFDGFSQKPKC